MQKFANFSVSTLASGINNSVTSLDVADGTVFPSTGDYVIRIDNEFLKVTARSTNTLTVVRAQDNSTAASHSAGAAVTQVITQSVLDAFRRENCSHVAAASFTAGGEGRMNIPDDILAFQRDGGSLITYCGPNVRMVKPPAASTFSWVNQGSATVTDTAVGIFFQSNVTTGGVQNTKILDIAAPSTPYTVTAKFAGIRWDKYNLCGLCFRDSVSGKWHGIHQVIGGSTAAYVEIVKFTNPTTYNSSAEAGTVTDMHPPPTWLRIKADGTNIYFYYSSTGLRWRLLGQAAKTSWLTNAPNRVGFFFDSTNATFAVSGALTSWEVN